MLYLTYIAEEVYTGADTNRMSIAPGCVGTRPGVRGQAGRCTLGEFCEYVWSTTSTYVDPGGAPDVRPNQKELFWGNMVKNWNDAGSLTANNIFNAISRTAKVTKQPIMNPRTGEQAVDKDGNPRFKDLLGKRLTPGFTGYMDTGVAMPAFASAPAQTRYYDAMEDVGNVYQRAKAHLDSNPAGLTDAQRSVLNKALAEARTAAELAVDLRNKMHGKLLQGKAGSALPDKTLAGNWCGWASGSPRRSLIPIISVNEPSLSGNKIQGSGVDKGIEMPSKDATLATSPDAVDARFGDRAAASTAWEAALQAIDNVDGGNHAHMLRSLRTAHQRICG